MGMNNKIIYKRILFTALSLFCICFIFSRSLMPGNKSGEESSKILELLNGIADFFGFGSIFTHNFVRKCAHFTEFAVLSIVLYYMYFSFFDRIKISICLSVLSFLLVSVADETIQYFVPGRACQLTDVLIDFLGGIFGVAFCMLFALLLRTLRHRSKA